MTRVNTRTVKQYRRNPVVESFVNASNVVDFGTHQAAKHTLRFHLQFPPVYPLERGGQ